MNTEQAAGYFAALRDAVLDGPGSTPSKVRHAVAAANMDEVSTELRDYVKTLREHAWRSTDSQVQQLIDVGWSEDQVYELTVAVALGAGERRLEAGLAVLAQVETTMANRTTAAATGSSGEQEAEVRAHASA